MTLNLVPPLRKREDFMLSSPSPCAYLEGQMEQRIFTPLVGETAPILNDKLSQLGFRRSQLISYRPACETCRACVSLRILVDEFEPNKTMRKLIARNNIIFGIIVPAKASSEQYALFRDYVSNRHFEGGMAQMSMQDYVMMVQETYARTALIEYRQKTLDSPLTKRGQGALKAFALTDILQDGLSMVYSAYDPSETARSLGTMMVIDHIYRAKDMKLPYVYLGFWVQDSAKMAYKAKFKPHERFYGDKWLKFT
jgi:leucyl-tRNA---protein transferase